MTVYRPAVASWYGPGFYGRRTACRLKLTRSLLGVAHKKLPCGTEVALLYRGESITVPVVDRGPFIRGRSWDLTATARGARLQGRRPHRRRSPAVRTRRKRGRPAPVLSSMLTRSILAAALALSLPATASAAAELGQTPPPTENCAATVLMWHTSAPYLAPTAGVITELRATAGTAGAALTVKVARPSTTSIVGTSAPLTVDAPGDVVADAVRIPVQAGDALGLYVGTETTCGVPGALSDTFSATSAAAHPGSGTVAGTVETGGKAYRMSIAGTLEPDADGDGFGDESQDACPADSYRTAAPCVADAHLTATATPAAIEVGDVAVLDISVTAPPGQTVRAARVAASLPAGLEPLLVTPHSCALALPFSCALGDVTGTSRERARWSSARRRQARSRSP